jgi:hypothetical protein
VNRRKLAIIGLSLLLLTGAGLVVLIQQIPRLVNEEEIKHSIEKGLHESTGVNFRIKKLTLRPTFRHGLQVHLNTTDITDMQHHTLADIGHITVQIRYLPILLKQVPEIAKIHIRDVWIPVGQYSLFKEVKLKLVKPKRMGFLKPAELEDTEILLSDYQVEDEPIANEVGSLLASIKKPAQRFQVIGRSISIRHLESKKPVEIKGAGLLSFLDANKGRVIPPVHYQIDMVLPQSVVKAKQPRYQDLARFNFDLKGHNTNLQIRYKRKPGGSGRGSIRAPRFDLRQGQMMILQLADTFGFELPPFASENYLAGLVEMDTGFQLRFPAHRKKSAKWGKTGKLAQPFIPKVLLQGKIRLNDVSTSRGAAWQQSLVNHLNGQLRLQGELAETKGLTFRLGELPISLKGWVKVNSKEAELQAEAFKADLGTVKRTLSEGGVHVKVLDNRKLQGKLDLIAKLKGKLDNPHYYALLWLKNGAYEDAALGLTISGVNARARFHGEGVKTLKYGGDIELSHADFSSTALQLSLQDLKAFTTLQGVLAAEKTPRIPEMDGWLQVGDGTYTHTDTGLALTRIHGKMLMKPSEFQIPQMQGHLGSALVNASGRFAPDFSRYQFHIASQNINIPVLKRETLAKMPGAERWMSQFNPTSGVANLDLTISTDARMQGRLTVSHLHLQTGNASDNTEGSPIQIPRLTVLFDEHRIVLNPSTVHYGPVESQIQGELQPGGAYRFLVNTGDVPLSTVRDNIGFINALAGLHLPEIWNTAGSFKLNGMFSSQMNRIEVSFNNAGLSWEGGDFPLYDMNGHLIYRAIHGEDFVGTRDLSFRYGNSPISIKAGSDDHFRLRAEGIFSSLLVNSVLVSPQSNATPYREVPFLIRAGGVLQGFPGTKESEHNKIATGIHLDLTPMIKNAYKSPLPVPVRLSEAPAAPPLHSQPSPSGSATPVAEEARAARRRRLRTAQPQKLLSRIQAKVAEALEKFQDQFPEEVETTTATTVQGPVAPTENQTTQEPGQPQQAQTAQLSEPVKFPFSSSVPPLTSLQTATAVPVDLADRESERGDADAAHLDLRILLSGDNMLLEKGQLHLFNAGDLLAEGIVRDLFHPERRAFLLHVSTQPEIALEQFSQRSSENDFFRNVSGSLAFDVSFVGRERLDSIEGWLDIDRVRIPYLTIDELSGRIDFPGGESARAEITAFNVPGVSARASATADSLLEFPVTLDNVKITGSFLNLDSLEQFSNSIVTPIIIEQLVHNFARPWQQGDPRIPIQFRDADLHFDEAILQNIIMSNLNSKLSVYANSFFELPGASLEAAGGKVTGYFSMNPNENNFMTLELNADNVKANALTRALLGVTNQVFGDLSGKVRFTTFGSNNDEMQDNANGTVQMKVTNGRLPAIAKVETLLATANLLRGGILGFNLNNLFRSLTFYDTNYFAELSGDMLVANGVLYTDNLISDGVNLDLVIQGSVDMGNGDANMLVNGRMRQDVSGKLGALGKLSIGSILRYLPALGTLGPGQSGLLSYLPGVGYVPGFGGPAGNFSYFQVRLLGKPDDPGAIRDFHWVHKNP